MIALVKQWVAVTGGAVVAVGLMLWQAIGNATVPGWLYVLTATGAFIGAAFKAWKEERVRANGLQARIEAADRERPSAVLRPVVIGHSLLIEVRNDSADGLFRATIQTDGGWAGRLEPLPAIWDLTESHEPLEISRGETARIRIATVQEDHQTFYSPDGEEVGPDYGWDLSYHRPPGHRGWAAGRRALDAPDAEWFAVRIDVRSQPQLIDGPVWRRLQLVGRHAVDLASGERFTPRPIVSDYDEPN
jgi:hypothetical protein